MKKLLVWALILIFACMPASAGAADDYQEIIGGILAHLSDGRDIQEWIDTTLSQNAGGGSDGIIFPLLHLKPAYDFSVYADALETKLDEGIRSVTTRQRAALLLSILDPDAALPAGFADETIGEMGIMSYVYGLLLLDHGFSSDKWSIGVLADQLAKMQLKDGGWAVSGQYSDPDVTAMVLQALCVCEIEDDVFADLTAPALSYLASAQLEDGGYSSYGNPACESSAQVIVALLSMGIDPLSDARFIKNGCTALDAMRTFRLEDGSFSHIYDGKTNTMACVQALSALISLRQPTVNFYDFSNFESAPAASPSLSLPLWKTIALGCIALFLLAGIIVSLCKRRAVHKRILLLLAVGAVAAFAVLSIDIQSTSSYYGEIKTDKPVVGQVWLSIRCDNAAGLSDDGSTPENGIILEKTAFDLYEGDTVFDLLTHAARKYSIHFEYGGANSDLAYVSGINHLYEYAYGDLSGWIYKRNGEIQSVGCGNCSLQDGDEISWHYSLNMGEDI